MANQNKKQNKKQGDIVSLLVDTIADASVTVYKMASKPIYKKLGIVSEEDKIRIEEEMKLRLEEEERERELAIERRNKVNINGKKLDFNELFFNCGLKNRGKDMPVLEKIKTNKEVNIYSFKLPTGVTISSVRDKMEHISDFFEVPQMNIKLEKKNGLMDIVITKENLYREVFNYETIKYKDKKYSNNLRFTLGHFINQDYLHGLLSIDMANDDIPHAFIGASTGAGKSNLIRTILLNFILTKTPEELELFLLDGKGGADYVIFEKAPHVFMNKCFSNPYDVQDILEGLGVEILRRTTQLFKEAEVNNYDEYIQKGYKLPRRLIIFDEYAIFKKDEKIFKKMQTLAGNICAQGRSAGIHIIIATQDGQKAVLETFLKYNLRLKIGFKCDNEQHSINICGQTGLQNLKLKGVGRVFGLPLEDVEYLQFKSVLAPSSEKMKKMILDKYPNGLADINLVDGDYKKIDERSIIQKNIKEGQEEDFSEEWGEEC